MTINFTRKYEISDKIEDIVERFGFELDDEDDFNIYYSQIFDATDELNGIIDPKGRLRDKYDYDAYNIVFRAEIGRGFNGEVCVELIKNDEFILNTNGDVVSVEYGYREIYNIFN